MNIQRTQNNNFNGTHLVKTNILKKMGGCTRKYLPQEANIVEMSFADVKDAKALDKLNSMWSNSFAAQITSRHSRSDRKIYALTTQTSNFDNINPNEVRALCDFTFSDKVAKLNFLQADPTELKRGERSMKHLGEALMLGLYENFAQTGIQQMEWLSTMRAKSFYRKIFPTVKDKPCIEGSISNMFLACKPSTHKVESNVFEDVKSTQEIVQDVLTDIKPLNDKLETFFPQLKSIPDYIDAERLSRMKPTPDIYY